MWLAIGGQQLHQCPQKQTLFLRFTCLKLKDRACVYTLHSGSHYFFFIFVPPSPRPIHDSLRVQLDMLKVELVSRVPDGPGHCSSPVGLKMVSMCLKRRKKSLALLLHFWILPLHSPHTFLMKGHSHSTWVTVSGCWQQNS